MMMMVSVKVQQTDTEKFNVAFALIMERWMVQRFNTKKKPNHYNGTLALGCVRSSKLCSKKYKNLVRRFAEYL